MKKKISRMLALLLAFVMVATMIPSKTYVSAAKKPKVKSIKLNKKEYVLKKGGKVTLKATVSPAKLRKSVKVQWKSSNKKVATVSNKGVVKAVADKGKATITAKAGRKKATCKITVGTAASNKNNNNTNTARTSTSAPATNPPANPGGTGNTPQATLAPSATPDPLTITTEKKSIEMILGEEPLELDIKASKEGCTYEWIVEDQAIVSIKDGIITACNAGKTKVTVKAILGKETSSLDIEVTVKCPELTGVDFLEKDIVLTVNQTKQINLLPEPAAAEIVKAEYTSSDTSVAVVTDKGVVTAVKNGKSIITVKVNDKIEAKCNVFVGTAAEKISFVEDKITLEKTKTKKIEPVIVPVGVTEKLLWESSDTKVASVDEDGNVTAKAVGSATISVTGEVSKKTASYKLSVIEIQPSRVTLSKGELNLAVSELENANVNNSEQLTAIVFPEDATDKNVTWESSDTSVATVVNGKVTAVKEGTAVITAKSVVNSEIKDTCTVTVKNNEIYFNTIEELNAGLENASGYVVFKTNDDGEFTINSGNYEDVILVVDAPNATIKNNATFENIEIRAIASDTWLEEIGGNKIIIAAEKAHVVLNNGVSRIEVAPETQNIHLEQKEGASVQSFVVRASETTLEDKTNIKITGSNNTSIPIYVAGDANITTTVPVDLDLNAPIRLTLMGVAASGSSASVANADMYPQVNGLGTIDIINRETNEQETVIADSSNYEEEEEGVAGPKGTVTGKVLRTNESGQDQAISNAAVYMIAYAGQYVDLFNSKNYDELLEAVNNQTETSAMNTDDDGNFKFENAGFKNYILVITAEGMQSIFTPFCLNTVEHSFGNIYMELPSEEKGSVTGQIYDAQTGKNISDTNQSVQVEIRAGSNALTGEPIETVMTDEDGRYKFTDLPIGTYTIQIKDLRQDVEENYITACFEVRVLAGMVITANMTISKQVDSEQIRFVLTWNPESAGNVSRDLDSHLIGPMVEGGKFHVYFSERNYDGVNGKGKSDLDVDDTTYEGPETTTIYQPIPGVYHYYIYDFTNQTDRDNTMLSTSNPIINVYRGANLIATYTIPDVKVGTLWDVCTYDTRTNTLTYVNDIYYHEGSSSDVGISPVDLAKNTLAKSFNLFKESISSSDETVNTEIDEKLKEAEKLLDKEDATREEVTSFTEEFNQYFNELLSSVKITSVSGREITDYDIYSDSLSVYGKTKELPDDFAVKCGDNENITFEFNEDKTSITVVNSDTKIKMTYGFAFFSKFNELVGIITDALLDYEEYYLGNNEELASERQQMSEEIRSRIDSANTYSELEEIYDDLKGYYEPLINSVSIESITGDIIHSAKIYDYRIAIEYKAEEFEYSQLSVNLYDEAAAYEWIEEEGDLGIVVKNNTTKAEKKYSVDYSKYIPSMYPRQIKDENNYISYYEVDYCWIYDEDGSEKKINTLSIYGDADRLNNPKIMFEDADITYTYSEGSDIEGYTGKITVNYMDEYEYVYYVKYHKNNSVHTIEIIDAEEEGNNYISIYNTYYDIYDEEDNYLEEIYTFVINGINPDMNVEALNVQFDTDITNYNILDASESAVAASGGALQLEEKGIKYVVNIPYAGTEQNIYIKYNGGNHIYPTDAYYMENDEEKRFIYQYYDEDIESYVVEGYMPSYDLAEEEVRFINDNYGEYDENGDYRMKYEFSVIRENDENYINVSYKGRVIDKYPVVYRAEPLEIASIEEPGNYIISHGNSSYWDGEKYDTYYYVNGINEELGDDVILEFPIAVDDYTIEPVEDNDYWNYNVKVNYMGTAATIHLNYSGGNHIYPDYAYYYAGDEKKSFVYCESDVIDGKRVYLVNDDMPVFDFETEETEFGRYDEYWDSETSTNKPLYEFEVIKENDETMLQVSTKGEVVDKYPIVYKSSASVSTPAPKPTDDPDDATDEPTETDNARLAYKTDKGSEILAAADIDNGMWDVEADEGEEQTVKAKKVKFVDPKYWTEAYGDNEPIVFANCNPNAYAPDGRKSDNVTLMKEDGEDEEGNKKYVSDPELAKAYVIWDEDYLYVMFDIKDTDVTVNDFDNPYLVDSTEFFLDEDNSKPSSYSEGGDEIHIRVAPNDNGYSANDTATGSYELVAHAAKITEGVGYRTQYIIKLNNKHKHGDIMGMDFLVNDCSSIDVTLTDEETGEEVLAKSSARACTITAYDTANENWQNPSYFGRVKLIDRTVEGGEDMP